MLTLLLDTIGTDRRLRVLEIGGGFGNMVRILKSHDSSITGPSSTSILCVKREAHFIKENFPELQVNRNSYDPRPGNINLIDQHHRNIVRRELVGADVLIGTHSWSELPLDDFLVLRRPLTTGKASSIRDSNQAFARASPEKNSNTLKNP